jgi:hypothetical protein
VAILILPVYAPRRRAEPETSRETFYITIFRKYFEYTLSEQQHEDQQKGNLERQFYAFIGDTTYLFTPGTRRMIEP